MTRHLQSGFSLIEVLIAMVIVGVGLLGIAAMQALALRSETESYQRVQALVLLNDMANRLSANRSAAGCYAVNAAAPVGPGLPPLGAGSNASYNCTAYGVIESQQIANADIARWNALLQGALESADGRNTGAMINARGCVTVDPTGSVFTIAVFWQGLAPTRDANDPTGCLGGGSPYGAGLTRAVSTTVRFATL